MERGLVVVGWYDAVEEGRRVECGGRGEGRVVERSVIVCKQSVVCHRVEGGAARIWRMGDGMSVSSPRAIAHSGGTTGWNDLQTGSQIMGRFHYGGFNHGQALLADWGKGIVAAPVKEGRMGVLLSKPDEGGSSAFGNGGTVTHSSRLLRKRPKAHDGLHETSSKRRRTANASHSNDRLALIDMATIAPDAPARNLHPRTKSKEETDKIIKAKSKQKKVTVLSFENSNFHGDRSIRPGGIQLAGTTLPPGRSSTGRRSSKDSTRTPTNPRSKRKAPTSPYFTLASSPPNSRDKKMSSKSKISVVETEIDLPSLPHFRPTSPDEFGLIQEKLRHEPWKMLVAVIFLNKTNAKVALPLLGQLFERWPTPEAISQSTSTSLSISLMSANVQELSTFLYPIGLYNTRARRLIDFSIMWLSNPPRPDVLTMRKGLPRYPPTAISHLPGVCFDFVIDLILDGRLRARFMENVLCG